METILVPRDILYPDQLREAESFNRWCEAERKYEAERRLMEDTLTTPEKIKNAWASYGSRYRDAFQGDYLRIAWHPPMRLPDRYAMDVCAEATTFETFDFERDVRKVYKKDCSLDYTVTRISCLGITVEETIS